MTGLFAAGTVGAQAQVRDFHRPFVAPVVRGREYGRPIYRPGFRVGVAVGAPVVADNYIPPCPGDGYVWTAGYYNGGIWVPGSWVFRGGYGVARVDHDGYFGRGRDFDRHDRDFNRGYARGYDRGAGRGFDRR